MYNPLAQTVAAAWMQHKGMSSGLDEDNPEPVDDGAHDKIMGKRHQLEHMIKDYFHESKAKKRLRKWVKATKRKMKNERRDWKIEMIRLINFNKELVNK